MKVIFRPYWSFATTAFSEMKLAGGQPLARPPDADRNGRDTASGVVREHLSPDGEGERDDEEHEQSHLCHEEEEDLWLRIVSITTGIVCDVGARPTKL